MNSLRRMYPAAIFAAFMNAMTATHIQSQRGTSNTGSSEDLTRMVTVKVGDAAEQSVAGDLRIGSFYSLAGHVNK